MDPAVADVVESFCAVELYLPDYISKALPLIRRNRGWAWFHANWGYEESKHSVALREYLLRTGQRNFDQIHDFEQKIFSKKWNLPFTTPRQMTIYGIIQELATYVIYKKQKGLAKEKGDELLSTIYGLIARDEIAHFGFYASVVRVLLEEDPEGTKADVAHVFRHFTMPAHDLIADYSQRAEVMRSAGIDRGVFIREVWLPALKALGLTRHDLPTVRERREVQELVAG
jgi:acyl-[acyl-carrier-protein] desaturase